ncbi:hypothetical protein F5Y19DRAFT_474173 [Xylariaceae sp. FL1651]|nr:hypothetical protein F5Y19DRAFT_474173 [Xylariaceae sp. FL1651]
MVDGGRRSGSSSSSSSSGGGSTSHLGRSFLSPVSPPSQLIPIRRLDDPTICSHLLPLCMSATPKPDQVDVDNYYLQRNGQGKAEQKRTDRINRRSRAWTLCILASTTTNTTTITTAATVRIPSSQ